MMRYPFYTLLDSIRENFAKNSISTSSGEHKRFPILWKLWTLCPLLSWGGSFPASRSLLTTCPDQFSAEARGGQISKAFLLSSSLLSGTLLANSSCLSSMDFHFLLSSEGRLHPGPLPAQQPENSVQAGNWLSKRLIPQGCLLSQGSLFCPACCSVSEIHCFTYFV